jgi:hypothetical protein
MNDSGTCPALAQDVMEVCRNGHVVTCRAQTAPEERRSHCDRCGADTLRACPTCGHALPGAVVIPGLQPIGAGKAPSICARCGAAFPWTDWRRRARDVPAARTLEAFFRRLPLVIRQLRQRFRSRPAMCVDDAHDLDDVVRSLLPLYFDHIYLRSRTPSYAAANRTDLLIVPDRIFCTLKHASPELRRPQLIDEVTEDTAYYRTVQECRSVWIYVYDPQSYLREPHDLEACCSRPDEKPSVRCVISG